MPPSSLLLTVSDTILWLKVMLSAAMLVVLYLRYRKGETSSVGPKTYPLRTKAVALLAVLFSFAVFHNLGQFRGGTFVHYGEMFNYYLGAKYFKELGYFEMYNAVIAADAEQDNTLARLPFYTDLRTYQNAQRENVLENIDSVRNLFSKKRWDAFKSDVAFFKRATDTPRSRGRPPGIFFLLMDHGYNASPVAAFVPSLLANIVPVTQLPLLAALDVVLVAAMSGLVFYTFGLEMGALFSIYFFVNILNDHDEISGGLLRYDWLLCIVAAVCLLEKGRYVSSAIFLTISAMIKVFPAILFYGIGVAVFQNLKATRTVDKKFVRFIAAAGVTVLVLFLLPAVQFGSVLWPWKDFSEKIALHDRGVYVNHLGLRGMVLFEPSHLSLEKFIQTFKDPSTTDIVRHWQDAKEQEFERRKPIIAVASLLVLVCLTAVIWKRRGGETEGILWPLLLVYTMSYPAHYYYAFLCLFILVFFRRPNSLSAFVPLSLLLILNIAVLVTDHFGPSPIVFFTLTNIYLFICLSSILGFELYANVFRSGRMGTAATSRVLRERA